MQSFITHIKGKAGIFSQNALVESFEVLRLNINNSFSAPRWPGRRIERCLPSLTENDFPVSTMLEKKEMKEMKGEAAI
jgi:hypothetical protein